MTAGPRFIKHHADRFRRWMGRDTDVTLTWVTLASSSVDGPTGAVLGTPTVRTETVKGVVYFSDSAIRSVVQFAEMELGDCIVDLPVDVTIEGREGLSFTILGQKWVQKKVSDKLAKIWDTVVGNVRLCRTLLLRKAT